MQWNIGTAPSVRRWRQVVGVRFTSHLQYADGDALRHFRTAGEPLTIGPGLNHFFGKRIAFVGFLFDIVELVKHQQGFLQTGGCHRCARFVVEQIDQRCQVVTTKHGAQQFGSFFSRQQGAFFCAVRHCSEVRSLDLRRIIHTRRYAVGNQINQSGLFALGWVFQQFNQLTRLFGTQRQRWNTQRSTFSHMVSVSFQHRSLS